MRVRSFEEADTESLVRIFHLAFGAPPEQIQLWFERAGSDNIRVVERGGDLAASLIDIPMGQFWGGRSVRMHGVAGVAVAPEARGAGVATTLMATHLRQLVERGVPLSALYASTRALYRGVGYEPAGTAFRSDVPLSALQPATRGPVRRAERAEVLARYSRFARRNDGWLDRGPYVWERVFRDAEAYETDGGHVVVHLNLDTGAPWQVAVRDLVAETPRAARALLGHLTGYATVARTARFTGGPGTALLDELVEHRAETVLKEPWLLRIVRVDEALAARGYPVGLTVDIHLDVRDALVPENHGPRILRVAGGRATVETGGDGTAHIDVRHLAPLFTGYRTPWSLRAFGHLEAPDDACESLAAVFAGPPPSLPDFF